MMMRISLITLVGLSTAAAFQAPLLVRSQVARSSWMVSQLSESGLETSEVEAASPVDESPAPEDAAKASPVKVERVRHTLFIGNLNFGTNKLSNRRLLLDEKIVWSLMAVHW
jgi:hypothetical protein